MKRFADNTQKTISRTAWAFFTAEAQRTSRLRREEKREMSLLAASLRVLRVRCVSAVGSALHCRRRRFMIPIFCLTLLIGADAIFHLINGESTAALETVDCGAAGSSFGVARQFIVSGRARSFAVGDFNGDGKVDVAFAAEGSDVFSNISIYLGDGGGYLEHVVNAPIAGSLGEIAVGDFNKDGKQDLAVSGPAANGENGVAILLGNGDATFHAPNNFAAASGARAMAIADFNGDGHQDIATANNFANNVAVLLGDGAGAFAAPVKYTVGAGPIAIVSSDFNDDGKPDLAVANQNNSFISLLTNNGAGGFNTAVNVDARFNCSSVAAGDFNGDGKTDLVVGQLTNIAVLIGDGRGGFGAPKSFGNRTASSIVVRDFSGDGKLDLALANNNTTFPSVALLIGNGAGEFGAATNLGAGKLPYVLATADFNQDSRDDLAVLNLDTGNSGATTFSILFGAANGSRIFRAPIISDTAGFPTSINLGDLNKDNKTDLIVTSGSIGGTISIGDGQGGFGAPQRLDTTAGFSGDAAAAVTGDFNKDGNVDLALATSDRFNPNQPGVIAILHGLGNGTFDRNRTRTFNVGNRPADIVAADFNGDGALDLATANPASNDVSVLLNNGAPGGSFGFGAAQNIPVGPEPRSLAASDFNGDQKTDLVVANRNSATLTIMLGDGKSGFITMPFGIGANPRAVKTGDFNRDGKIDLAAPHNNAGFVSILLGNGDGSFAPPANVNIGRLPFAIVIGDFNSDGKQDFAASVYFSQETTEDRVLIFAGDGAGRFGFAGEFVTPNASYLAASDFNADGLTDLAAMSGVSVWAAINECNAASAIALTNVSAASYRRLNLASESIVAAFGAGLSAGTASAPTLPLPTQLGGSSVKVKDSAGVERAAPLFFVSPNQINYQMPAGLAAGAATITITSGAGASISGTTRIATVAPGLFSANANGQGVAAGVALRVKPNGERTFEPIAQFDAAQNQFVPLAIDLGVFPPNAATDVYLILFGTGLRNRPPLSTVQARIGGQEVPVLFAGAQGDLAGLDQINMPLPRNLILRGEVDVVLTVDGRTANAVRIKIQ